jgi:hypothetical protein
MGIFDDLLDGFGDRHHRGPKYGQNREHDHGHHDDHDDHDRRGFFPQRGDPHPDVAARVSCPKCAGSVLLAPDSRFCPACGAPLSTATACRSCGAKLAPGAAFCQACGTKA